MRRGRSLPLLAVPLVAVSCGTDSGLPRPLSRNQPGTRAVSPLSAEEAARRQVVYLPVYSHTYITDSADPYLLSATINVRNTDPRHPIILDRVSYHDSQGRPIQLFVASPIELIPLGSIEFFIRPSDTRGGTGASVLIGWSARDEVSPPLVEAVMIGTSGSQGVSFVTRGVVVEGLDTVPSKTIGAAPHAGDRPGTIGVNP